MRVIVLRLNHRPNRDKRVSTHLLLAARALGASSSIYTGKRDQRLEESVRDVVEAWGGSFTIDYAESWRKVIREWDGKVIHLTMYGLPIQDKIREIRDEAGDKLVVVGGSKVPGEVYGATHWNIAVTNQPHSEVSALAVFLHMLFDGEELKLEHPNRRLHVIPQAHGKEVEESDKPV